MFCGAIPNNSKFRFSIARFRHILNKSFNGIFSRGVWRYRFRLLKVDLRQSSMNITNDHFPKRYSAVKKIGYGAQGDVFSARDNQAGRDVVIKRLMHAHESAKYAYREFAILKFVNHCNVIKMLDAFTPQTNLVDFSDIFFVTEYMDRTLDSVIKPRINDHNKISFITYQLLCGVNYLHQANIIHRDLKPNNVMINSNCQVKIIDFGLARKSLEEIALGTALEQPAEGSESWLKLTPYVMVRNYRAPEIFFKLKYDEEADVWSIGCILAELFLGVPLFPGTNDLELIRVICTNLGKPAPSFINQIALEKQRIIRQLSCKPRPWSKILPDSKLPKDVEERLCASNARDLISKMLVINPEDRISTQRSLCHSYVHMWYQRSEVEPDFNTPQFNTSELEDSERSLEEWMELLFDEIKEYESNQQQTESSNTQEGD